MERRLKAGGVWRRWCGKRQGDAAGSMARGRRQADRGPLAEAASNSQDAALTVSFSRLTVLSTRLWDFERALIFKTSTSNENPIAK